MIVFTRFIKMKFLFCALAIVVLLILGFAGCSKDNGTTNPSSMTDEEALQYQIVHSDSLAQFLASDENTIDDGAIPRDPEYGIGKANAFVPVVRYARHIFWNLATRTYATRRIADTAAVVTVTSTLPGEFLIGVGTRFTADSARIDSIIRKPFTDVITRAIQFKRIARTSDPSLNWLPVAISLARAKSQPDSLNAFRVFKIQFTSTSNDTMQTDPIHAWNLLGRPLVSGIPFVHVLDSVRIRVWVQSSNDSAEVVHLRHGVGGAATISMREKMKIITDVPMTGAYNRLRVYERTFAARTFVSVGTLDILQRFDAVVDAVSYNSIYDNIAPFTNEFWGFPYIVYK